MNKWLSSLGDNMTRYPCIWHSWISNTQEAWYFSPRWVDDTLYTRQRVIWSLSTEDSTSQKNTSLCIAHCFWNKTLGIDPQSFKKSMYAIVISKGYWIISFLYMSMIRKIREKVISPRDNTRCPRHSLRQHLVHKEGSCSLSFPLLLRRVF